MYKEKMYIKHNKKEDLIINDFKKEFNELHDIINLINLRLVE